MKAFLIKMCASALLISLLLLSLASCAIQVRAYDLMAGVTPRRVSGKDTDESFVYAERKLALSLFREAYSSDDGGGNVFLSPLSIQLALAMTANGANGETLSQMETLLGGNIPLGTLNEYLYTYVNSLPSADKCKLNIANSIWIHEGAINVLDSFLQTNADYYGAAAYRSPFDSQTVKDINNWASLNTDGMIKKVLEKIPDEAVMYLVNAVMLDAEWQTVYTDRQILDGYFTSAAGERQDAEFMFSEESAYIETEGAVGLLKSYRDGKYAFAALLPDEDITLDEYISSLSPEALGTALDNITRKSIKAYIPKFGYEYSLTMNDILKELGMTNAFDPDLADFSRLGTATQGYNIFISSVLHKTYISVDERGTRAGAVTVVEMEKATSADPGDTVVINLDRPFVYMIIDTECGIPIFIGSVNSLSS